MGFKFRPMLSSLDERCLPDATPFAAPSNDPPGVTAPQTPELTEQQILDLLEAAYATGSSPTGDGSDELAPPKNPELPPLKLPVFGQFSPADDAKLKELYAELAKLEEQAKKLYADFNQALVASVEQNNRVHGYQDRLAELEQQLEAAKNDASKSVYLQGKISELKLVIENETKIADEKKLVVTKLEAEIKAIDERKAAIYKQISDIVAPYVGKKIDTLTTGVDK